MVRGSERLMSLVGYYAEINGVSIAMLALLLWQIRRRETGQHTSTIVFKATIWVTILLCLSDFFAAFFRGKTFTGARPLIESFNILFLASGVMICCLWLWYVVVMTSEGRIKPIHFTIMLGPAAIIVMSILLNPLTHFYFTINEENLYVRGTGVILQWAVAGAYVLAATVASLINCKRTNNSLKKVTFRSLSLFIIPTFVGVVIQCACYGVTSIQIGIAFSMLLIFMESETSLVSKDDMTGINNRRALNMYISSQLEKSKVVEMSVMVISTNEYHAINDVYGHLEGDEAVRTIAGIIGNVIGTVSERVGLYRFSNADFIVASNSISDETFAEIKRKLHDKMDNYNVVSSKQYALSTTCEISRGLITSIEDFEKLVGDMREKISSGRK